MSEKNCANTRVLDLIGKIVIFGLIAVGVFIIYFHFSYARLNTADSSIYLSTAENIASHKGFVASYNLCQCFKTLYHPIWAYYQPLFSLLSSLFIQHGGIVKIIQINILFFALNVALVFYLIQEYCPTRFNILFIFFLVFSYNFFISALYAWTEQFHFFCFILTFILFLKYQDRPRVLLALGILNGIFMLVRVAHLYNFAAYFPVFLLGGDNWRKKINKALFFAGGFILAYGTYQLFCISVYHTWYPEYAKPGASYGIARLYSGIVYEPGKVGLMVPAQPLFTIEHLTLIEHHLRDLYRQLPLWVLPAFFYYFLPHQKRAKSGFIELCISQCLFIMIGYSVTFYWLPSRFFEAYRYSLIPYVLVSLVGWYCLYQGTSLSGSLGKKMVGVIVLLLLIFPRLDDFLGFQWGMMTQSLWSRPYYQDYEGVCQWVDHNLPSKVLIASDEDQQGFFLHRPFISTPPGNSFNCPNLRLYDKIYAPDYYLLSDRVSDACIKPIAPTLVFSNKFFRILKSANGRRTAE